jgi:Mlc titration factor MtfA (ptsG expression regulator)
MDAGEAWQNGQVVLSWQDVLSDCRNPDDGRNLFIHEFAHCLDGLDGEMVAVIVRFRPGCVDVTARSALQLKGLDDVQSVLT